MDLTDNHLEAIKAAAKGVDFGSVTININSGSGKLDLNVQNRIRLKQEPTRHRNPMPKEPRKGFQD